MTIAVVDKTAMARRCLRLISEIAIRGARSSDPEIVGYVLQELTQVLYERTGDEDRQFASLPPDNLYDLPALWKELDFVNGCAESMTSPRGGWTN